MTGQRPILCGHYDGTRDEYCRATPATRYIIGPRCKEHTPAKIQAKYRVGPAPTGGA